MDLGIKAKDIMKEDFPILYLSAGVESCIQKIDGKEACMVINRGFFDGLIGYNELIRTVLDKKENLGLEKLMTKNFTVVDGNTDLIEVIRLMNEENADFVVVKENNSLGLITKTDLIEVNESLFEKLEQENSIIENIQ